MKDINFTIFDSTTCRKARADYKKLKKAWIKAKKDYDNINITVDLPDVKKRKALKEKIESTLAILDKEIPINIKWAIGNPLSFAKMKALKKIQEKITKAVEDQWERTKKDIANGQKKLDKLENDIMNLKGTLRLCPPNSNKDK